MERIVAAMALMSAPPESRSELLKPLENKARDELSELEEELLTPPTTFGAEWLNLFQQKPVLDLLEAAKEASVMPPFLHRTEIKYRRRGLDGNFEAPQEIIVPPQSLTGIAALSMTRDMSQKSEFVRGSSSSMPFTPGGLDLVSNTAPTLIPRDDDGLFSQLPGLSRGLVIAQTQSDTAEQVLELSNGRVVGGDEEDEEEDEEEDLGTKMYLRDQIKSGIDITEDVDAISIKPRSGQPNNDIDSLLPDEMSFMRLKPRKIQANTERVWAHKVDVEKGMPDFDQLVPNPARTWPFELDTFQKEAVYHLEKGDSVFVAAHTSAGKTVVAEYAMSLARQHMTKCIYTSPIKALSNQKYRDFREDFDDVGILTGDVQINPEASTLIMTTEILRSMLYRGADLIRDVEFVIFDEVHYVNDQQRGVVWEEVIIMLPDHVKFVLLSATVPNVYEFATWIGRSKQKDIYVISTQKRPVPLTHHIWTNQKLFTMVNESKQFLNDEWTKMKNTMQPPALPSGDAKGDAKNAGASGRGGRGGARGGARGGRGGARGGSQAVGVQNALKAGKSTGRSANSGSSQKTKLEDLLKVLKQKSLLPAVFFEFSRKKVEQHAGNIQNMNFNTGHESALAHLFISQALSRLREEDRNLPQISTLKALLGNGIGVHHSGLLPIMKEVVEILFARGLVKVLFATETFAMGLNLPTRTVVFMNLKKFDSTEMRDLTPGEYTQMAGRAGRRGLDKEGTVIIMSENHPISQQRLQRLILGQPVKLTSKFRLTYNMILSLLNIEAVRIEDVLQQSFSENVSQMLQPEKEKSALKAEKQLATLQNESTSKPTPEVERFVEITHELHTINNELLSAAVKKLSNRLVLYHNASCDMILGVWKHGDRKQGSVIRVAIAAPLKRGANLDTAAAAKRKELPAVPALPDYMMQHYKLQGWRTSKPFPEEVSFDQIDGVLEARITNSQTSQSLSTLQNSAMDSLHRAYTEGLSELEVSKFVGIEETDSVIRRQELLAELYEIPSAVWTSKDFKQQYIDAKFILDLKELAKSLREAASTANAHLPDYNQRLELLKELKYIDEDLNVQLKGRAACEITTGYEVFITELLFDNFLGSYEPEEIAALLSVFVFEGIRGASEPDSLTPRLDEGRDRICDIVREVQLAVNRHQVSCTPDEQNFLDQERFALVPAIYEWARGMTFFEIMKFTPVQEGILVRVITRLEEVTRSVMNAARLIGDVEIYKKLSIARERIRRDIVFCSSLYV